MEFDQEIFNKLLKKFENIKKRIIQKRPLSKKKTKHNEYVELLIENYNSILLYTCSRIDQLSAARKLDICNRIVHCREVLVRCFGKLDCKIRVPHGSNLFEQINKYIKTDTESDSEHIDLEKKRGGKSCGKVNKNLAEKSQIAPVTKMATLDQKKSFVSMCANIIRDNYNGNPLALESFLDKVNLIQELTDENMTSTLISFLKSKLEGKARDSLPERVNSVDEIKNALKEKIKPDSSKVIGGKIAALQIKNNNYAEFTKQAEELADALERSLVIEGMTKAKAHEMAIEQTVSVCRLNTKSDLVKSILASTSFADPKEVVAKLVIEQTNESKERQVLAIHTHGHNNDNYNRNRFNNYRGNNSYRGANHRRGYSHSFNSSRGNNYNRNGNSYNRGNYRYNNNGHDNSNYRGARTLTLNAEAPQQEMLGEADIMEEADQN